ncbi:ImmA/IrrE family metallo-endopeptidase [Paractinoplanes hotanensis]|uniref:ImmA/IrrE family metallo-endopeptidase n=1 Tax=Paractinoplanes hotanensis TaxID=2906497 RepID=A0ABT0YCX8_9ACTN|nr:ImmA/IrrE family metallo-endopeptidase [Actinoplanes hotanensis]MCM4083920.1 ImmA/IrrE family metallo-endopeptidase [Actinoplanes hotanensis]
MTSDGQQPTTARKIRQHCEQIARGIVVPKPFELDLFVREVGASRRRTIETMAFSMPAGAPRGVCVATDTRDYIIVDEAAAGSQRAHIILHEISHLLLGHQLRVTDFLDQLFVHLNMGVIQDRRVIARTTYNTTDEREAEILASILGHRAGLWRSSPKDSSHVDDPLMLRLGAAFEHERRVARHAS